MARPDGTVIWNNRQAKLLQWATPDVRRTAPIPVTAYHPRWALKHTQQRACSYPYVAAPAACVVAEHALFINPQ